jgi:hypothetical protein
MSEPNYNEIRHRITSTYNNRIGFFSHFIAFVVINGFAWMIWLGTPEAARSGVLSVVLLLGSVGWLVGMLIHALVFFMMEARDRAIVRAIEEERAWALGEKPKRESRLHLTEDGELEEIVGEELETPAKRRYR